MRLPVPWWLPYALLAGAVAFGVGSCVRYRNALMEKGRQEERGAQARHEADSLTAANDSLRHVQTRVDTVLGKRAAVSTATRDSLKLARTAADSLARLLAIRDADSATISACVVARATCEERAVTAERLADARLRELTARIATPTIRRRWGVGGTLGFGAVYDLARKHVASGPGVTIGVSYSF